eukprot:365987-Chlamydomonas_euryale.AAC.19
MHLVFCRLFPFSVHLLLLKKAGCSTPATRQTLESVPRVFAVRFLSFVRFLALGACLLLLGAPLPRGRPGAASVAQRLVEHGTELVPQSLEGRGDIESWRAENNRLKKDLRAERRQHAAEAEELRAEVRKLRSEIEEYEDAWTSGSGSSNGSSATSENSNELPHPGARKYKIKRADRTLRLCALSFGPNDLFYCLEEEFLNPDRRGFWPVGFPSRSLHNKLIGRQKSLPGVAYLSMGWETEDEWGNQQDADWFIRFVDGSCAYNARDNQLYTSLRDREVDDLPLEVYFGANSSWVLRSEKQIVYSNNLQSNVRSVIDEVVSYPKAYGSVQDVALGPQREFCVISTHGHVWSASLHPALEGLFSRFAVKQVRLGIHGTFCGIFENLTIWRATKEFSKAVWPLLAEQQEFDF